MRPPSTASTLQLSDLDYELPPELIAQRPLPNRQDARLLVVDAHTATGMHAAHLTHASIAALPTLLPPSLWVVNDTRVIPARLHGHKPSGGAVELLLMESLGNDLWRCLGRASKRLRPGTTVRIGDDLQADIVANEAGTLTVRFAGPDVAAALVHHGRMPLPPYIEREVEPDDAERYQTMFAAEPGAVAAPTAGLHFSPALVTALRAEGHELARITLHVGPGTFRPIRADSLDAHPMHEERYGIGPATVEAIADARRRGRPIVAVGTTVVRALESAAIDGASEEVAIGPGAGRTRLFIKPPYRPRVVDHLLTNFHLPRSTLLALVMALAGTRTTREGYAEAIRARYRFFSYGDAMLLRGVRPQ